MRKEFEKLTTTLPVSFEELAKIGQLAAQTGVANDQLVRFSDTVVRFSVTTGIASDQVTVLFARIADMLDLPTNQMNNFASTILKLGTISAATENEILKVTQSIASASRAFGLSTEEVAGLSGALASLRIPPEWARGSATRIFRDLDNAANGAGEGMKVLTEVIGMNADEIMALRRTDPGRSSSSSWKECSSSPARDSLLRVPRGPSPT
jgi:TP901 family phage tail tape measure protein